jgi:hypothetical protein
VLTAGVQVGGREIGVEVAGGAVVVEGELWLVDVADLVFAVFIDGAQLSGEQLEVLQLDLQRAVVGIGPLRLQVLHHALSYCLDLWNRGSAAVLLAVLVSLWAGEGRILSVWVMIIALIIIVALLLIPRIIWAMIHLSAGMLLLWMVVLIVVCWICGLSLLSVCVLVDELSVLFEEWTLPHAWVMLFPSLLRSVLVVGEVLWWGVF